VDVKRFFLKEISIKIVFQAVEKVVTILISTAT